MSCPRSVGELGADGSLVASADFKSVAVSGDRRWVGSIPTRSRHRAHSDGLLTFSAAAVTVGVALRRASVNPPALFLCAATPGATTR